MKEDIEDLKAVVDQLLIRQSIDEFRIEVLTQVTLLVFDQVLPENESKNVRRDFYNRLVAEKTRLSALPDLVYDRRAALRALFDFHEEVQHHIRELDRDDPI
jgi:hypothetical protein